MQISETILLIIIIFVTAVSALCCILGLSTPGWSGTNNLFCTGCPTSSAGLSIVAFILLIAAILVLLLLIFRILPKSIRFLPFFVLFLATIFTLATYASYFDALSLVGYSYRLMVVAHFLCYVASLMIAFWLGGSFATTITTADIT